MLTSKRGWTLWRSTRRTRKERRTDEKEIEEPTQEEWEVGYLQPYGVQSQESGGEEKIDINEGCTKVTQNTEGYNRIYLLTV